ncbi:hypothetical protein D9M72_377700 [compost metagenome]
MIHLPPPEGMKKPSTAEYAPITTAKLSTLEMLTNRCAMRSDSVMPASPLAPVNMAAMAPYSGNWMITPAVDGTARDTASRKLRGRQCSSSPIMRNSRL